MPAATCTTLAHEELSTHPPQTNDRIADERSQAKRADKARSAVPTAEAEGCSVLKCLQAEILRPGDGFGAGVDSEFAVDARHVGFDGALGDKELPGDLLVGTPGAQELQYG